MESWVVSRQEDLTEVKDQDKEQEGKSRQILFIKNIIEIIPILLESGEGDLVPKGRVLLGEERRP